MRELGSAHTTGQIEVTGRAITPEEQRAADAVARVLRATVTPRDIDGAPDMSYDFDLLLTDGRKVALEITAASDQDTLRQHAQAFKRDWAAPSLQSDWQIGVNRVPGQRPVDLIPVRKLIEPILAIYERFGITEIGAVAMWRPIPPPGSHSEVADAMKRMFALGVTMARCHRPANPPGSALVLLSIHGGHGANIEELNQLVEEHAAANIKKLRLANADERHLYVWVNATTPDAELALHIGETPTLIPVLPEGIDTVWVGSWGVTSLGKQGFERLLRVAPKGVWKDLDASQL
jgi:hypothetical protein